MHRTVVEQCLPSLIALAVLFGLLWAAARLSGGRLRLGRLRDVHRCEAGGVQSLAFVLTLPVFMMILLFIVQVSQLMLGMIAVNYAAYASARSASVWVPAWIGSEDENVLPTGLQPGQNFMVDASVAQSSVKYSEMFDAATLACVPIAPSRDLGNSNAGQLGSIDQSALAIYSALSPTAASNPRLPQRLRNKIAYARQNTVLYVTYTDKNSGLPGGDHGPTYNPYDHPTITWNPSEVGWQDPVAVEVEHRFALLPGPGRFLAVMLVRPDGRADETAPLILYEGGVHKVRLTASATMTVEGIKSARPYLQTDW